MKHYDWKPELQTGSTVWVDWFYHPDFHWWIPCTVIGKGSYALWILESKLFGRFETSEFELENPDALVATDNDTFRHERHTIRTAIHD